MALTQGGGRGYRAVAICCKKKKRLEGLIGSRERINIRMHTNIEREEIIRVMVEVKDPHTHAHTD